MRELTADEIDQVGGGFAPLIGGALGGASYLLGTVATGGKPTLGGFAGSVTFGAVTSGLSVLGGSLSAAGNIARNIHATGIGTVSGAAVDNIVTASGNGQLSTLHELEE